MSRAAGALLAAATRVVAALRPAAKPLHPRGTVWEAEITRADGHIVPTGVAWLDEPGHEEEVLVRVSAAVGLPHGWPDIQGLALRVPTESGPADLLLASTGAGRLTRFLLRPVRPSTWHLTTTLLPYRGPTGPIILAAAAAGPRDYVLMWSSLGGDWYSFGWLHLVRRAEQEPSFDPIRRPLPGLPNYAWVTRLREPAYRVARRSRDVSAA